MTLATRRQVGAAAVMTAAALAFTTPAHAAAKFDLQFKAGVACPFVALGINITPNANRVFKTFTDSNGNEVRTISAGKGSILTFTNKQTGKTVSLESNGSVAEETFN